MFNLKYAKILPLTLFLSACAAPLPFKVASLVADGISYIATSKSVTDHGISIALDQDCAMLKAVTEGQICTAYADRDGGPELPTDVRVPDARETETASLIEPHSNPPRE